MIRIELTQLKALLSQNFYPKFPSKCILQHNFLFTVKFTKCALSRLTKSFQTYHYFHFDLFHDAKEKKVNEYKRKKIYLQSILKVLFIDASIINLSKYCILIQVLLISFSSHLISWRLHKRIEAHSFIQKFNFHYVIYRFTAFILFYLTYFYSAIQFNLISLSREYVEE